MRTTTRFILHLATAGLLATAMACGGGGGGSTETAEITGTLSPVSGASVHTSAASTTGLTIVAVDENGNSADAASGVTGDFTLTVPTGHDYVLIVSDSSGILSAVVYKDTSGATSSEMAVVSGTARVDLGTITVDTTTRTVEVADPSAVTEEAKDGTSSTGVPKPAESKMKSDTDGDGVPDTVVDTDGDHIPDAVDTDKDNDGIENSEDKDPATGADLSTDMDNDGVDDAVDTDVDGDGVANADDVGNDQSDLSRDTDNDGVANDRDADDDNDGVPDTEDDDHPSHVMDGTVSGDATTGAEKFAACTGCHGSDGSGGTVDEDIRDASSAELAKVLANGNDDGMPAFTDLVDFAADIAAFLADPSAADSTTDTGSGSGSTDSGSGSTGSGSGSTGGSTGSTGGGTTTVVGDATAGGTYFASNCAGCHGSDGSGGAVVSQSIRGSSTTVISGAFTSVSMMSGLTMPTDQQLADLEAFLTP